MLAALRRIWRRWRRPRPGLAEVAEQQQAALRRRGLRIGEGCRIYTEVFSTEPWLISLGNRVGVAGGVRFLTHDGAAFMVRGQRPAAQSLGTIAVGDDCFIGENALLLPGTQIGDGCVVIAGAVVRGRIPPNAVVAGNPAQVVGRASLFLARLREAPNTLDSYGLPEAERRSR